MVSTIDRTAPIYWKIMVMPEELEALSQREYADSGECQKVYNYKCCPTRHGCSGATNCDNAYGNYHR